MNLKVIWRELRDGLAKAKRAEREHGISIWQQFREIRALRANHVGVQDYYFYRLFDPVLHPDMVTKLTYGGWRAFSSEFRRYSEKRLQAMAYEKHVFYRLCEAFDVPSPKIHAVYAPTPDCFERHRALTDRNTLGEWLRTTDYLPVFGKPSSACSGFGGRAIMSRDGEGRFHMADDSVVTLDELLDDLEAIAAEISSTYIFTDYLENHDEIKALAGDTTASYRIIVLVRNGEPELFRTSILIPSTADHVSNVRGGESGTLPCAVDNETGVITKAIWGMGLDAEEVETHPISGVKVLGYRFECWPEVRDMVLRAARAMSPFRMQHWDIAMTTRGPVVMEMNFIGGVEGTQFHGPPGLYTEQYLSFAADHKYPVKDSM
ncbi:MAG: hypothetical protein GY838_00875 [bacterium]|nr:hypothetical protein [bacterium]